MPSNFVYCFNKKGPGVSSGASVRFCYAKILEYEADTCTAQALIETLVTIDVTGIEEETNRAVDAVFKAATNVAVALCLVVAPG